MVKMTKWDKLLIIVIVIVSIYGLYAVKTGAFNEGTKYVVVDVNGQEYKRISLGPNMVGKTIDIETKYGYNKIEFGDEKVRVIEADCPDKLDVKQGWISRPGEVIVCLPNLLVIEIISDSEQNMDYDYMSH